MFFYCRYIQIYVMGLNRPKKEVETRANMPQIYTLNWYLRNGLWRNIEKISDKNVEKLAKYVLTEIKRINS